MAVMVVLERLTPARRATLLLRRVRLQPRADRDARLAQPGGLPQAARTGPPKGLGRPAPGHRLPRGAPAPAGHLPARGLGRRRRRPHGAACLRRHLDHGRRAGGSRVPGRPQPSAAARGRGQCGRVHRRHVPARPARNRATRAQRAAGAGLLQGRAAVCGVLLAVAEGKIRASSSMRTRPAFGISGAAPATDQRSGRRTERACRNTLRGSQRALTRCSRA